MNTDDEKQGVHWSWIVGVILLILWRFSDDVPIAAILVVFWMCFAYHIHMQADIRLEMIKTRHDHEKYYDAWCGKESHELFLRDAEAQAKKDAKKAAEDAEAAEAAERKAKLSKMTIYYCGICGQACNGVDFSEAKKMLDQHMQRANHYA